mmetsp:Transcript_4922/g.5442  ORF Transcript_4922/g.5442 Transcript_4922/m.5442 type:complete len:432 (+) Transcript_4922:299-1594(+)
MFSVNRLFQFWGLFQLAAFAVASDGFVKVDFDVYQGLNLSAALSGYSHLSRRDGDGSYDISLGNEKSFYVSKLKIGTPESEVSVLLDTGSSDLWVMSSKNPQCLDNGGSIDCEQYGTYNETASSTFHDNNTDFSIQYVDQTYAKGTWGTDTISLNEALKLENASFAVADDSDSNVGVFGIGFKGLESNPEQYSNLPITMKEQGFIKKLAYSLYLTSAESETGSILFGAIDHAKYEGELATIDIGKVNGEYAYAQIPLTSVSVHVNSDVDSEPSGTTVPSTGSSAKSSNNSSPQAISVNNSQVLLDSGTTLTYLQDSIIQEVLKQADKSASYSSLAGGYIVSCSLRQPGNSMTFRFNDEKDIKVPFSNLVLQSGQDPNTGKAICLFGVLPSEDIILGDNFLRSSYSVFNLDDKTISIAQLKQTNDEDIEVIN